jgi:hypothetical protein
MIIIDGQIHLWEKGTPSAHHRQQPYLAEQAIAAMDAAGVDRPDPPGAVGPGFERVGDRGGAEIPRSLRDHGLVYLDNPRGRDIVAHWKERPGMLGLRFYTNDRHPQSWFTDGTLDWLWPAADRAGVPVSLGAAMFLPTVGRIAERHPGLKLIVDHTWGFNRSRVDRVSSLRCSRRGQVKARRQSLRRSRATASSWELSRRSAFR